MPDYTDAAAVYPAAAATAANYPQRAQGDIVESQHMNAMQAEVIKIETNVGAAPNGSTNQAAGKGYWGDPATFNPSSPPAFGNLTNRVAYAETGLKKFGLHGDAPSGVHGVGAGAVVGTTLPQTLTNKTLESPTINGTVSGNPTFAGDVTILGTLTAGGTNLGVPVGTVIMWFGAGVIPGGWIEMNGATTITSASHPALWAALGASGGSYVIPNMSDRVPVGKSGTRALGSVGGAESTTLAASNLPAHTHTMNHNHSAQTTGSGNHAHTGVYRSFNVSSASSSATGWDLLRPHSQDNYAMEGNFGFDGHGGRPPTMTPGDGGHGHGVSVSAFTGDTGSTGQASPAVVSTMPPYLALRFLIKA